MKSLHQLNLLVILPAVLLLATQVYDDQISDTHLMQDYYLIVDAIATGKETPQEIAIALANFIAHNIDNTMPEPPSYIESWKRRSGLCAFRRSLLEMGMKHLGYETRRCNWESDDTSHACCEVYYDDRWHFFDPTYAGYFVGTDGAVMSFDEMVTNAEAAVAGMRVIGDGLDWWNGVKVDNTERMENVYTVEKIRKMRRLEEP